jgi:hypothetical protein
MAAHRYWRLVVWRPYSNDNKTRINEIILATTPGGAQAAVGGTATASSTAYITTNPPSAAFDGVFSATNWWYSSTEYVLANGYYQGQGWLQYDMGAGNAIDVVEMRLYEHSNNSQIGNPRDFSLFYSDNGTTFTHKCSWSNQVFTDGETKTYDVTVFNSTGHVVHDLQYRYNAGAVTTGFLWHCPERFTNNTPFSGPYYIAGSTTVLGEPYSRRVDLVEQKSGLLARSIYSGEDGVFLFENIGAGPWSVIGVDESASRNSVIYAHVNPILMTY